MKKISVVMTTFNETERELKLAVESILNQNYKEFEFIIILDNPSNKEHVRIIQDYCKKDDRIRFYVNEKNLGLAMSLNRGLELANCEIIARMDADDISLPDRFEKEISYLIDYPEVSVVGTNKISIDEDNNVLSYGGKLPDNFETTKLALQYISMVVHPSVMFIKKDILSLGGYRNFPASQDYDLWLRVISNGMKIGFVDEYLIKYRSSTKNISGSNPLKQWLCDKYIKKMHQERLKHGKDSFTEGNLMLFLRENNFNNEKEKGNFKKGKVAFDAARNLLKNHKYLNSALKLAECFWAHEEMKSVINNAIRYQKLARQINDKN
ncbi:Glycosyl transferase family 2 [Bacillus sp. OV166]|uniref:glycosyltransferase n=1 Tax=Bacillus sp. OV166 TaxID=1882763 RepID=UPI000A2AB418|nr:glycosyltransferase [Bacillus sp. OV166]SMQ85073.1 Glycosyl transferase family 2 [Bacillus sp. OV166]